MEIVGVDDGAAAREDLGGGVDEVAAGGRIPSTADGEQRQPQGNRHDNMTLPCGVATKLLLPHVSKPLPCRLPYGEVYVSFALVLTRPA
jgi:hypothetical protein